jgi:hypothetical protein
MMTSPSPKRIFKVATHAVYYGARVSTLFLLRIVDLLAGSVQTTPADDELNTSVRGGVLNYRTGKLDEGTDPYGWYERD